MKKINFRISRTLLLEMDGCQQQIEMVVGGLTQKGNEGPWGCECLIDKVLPQRRTIYGEDEIHALVNCLAFCSATLKDFCSEGRQVWWLEPGDMGAILDISSQSFKTP